ncbi:MAG: fibronectin type III domain-containing protein [Nitrospirae bacterium]|nr:fibronectin type III domain-containing protein [Nitrospirota bacterium]
MGGIGFVPGEATVGSLPACEPGKTNPVTDTVETEQTYATFVLCANEPARFQCSVDGGPSEPCVSPLLLRNLEFGRRSLVVIASDGNGNTQEGFVSFRWLIAPREIPAPTGLTAQAGDGGAVLSWQAVAGATGYKVYYGPSADSLGQSVRATETSTSIGGLANGTTYYFAVTALAGEKESPRSAAVSATPIAGAVKILSAPTGLVATAGDGKVTLAWGAVEGAASYKVYYGTAQNSLDTAVGVTGLTAEIAGLANGTAYYFAVASVDASGGESGKSEVVKSTPSAAAIIVGSQTCVLDTSILDACTLG